MRLIDLRSSTPGAVKTASKRDAQLYHRNWGEGVCVKCQQMPKVFDN